MVIVLVLKVLPVLEKRLSLKKDQLIFPKLTNLKLKEYLRETGQDEEFNDAIEEGSGWGNLVWKKVGKKYERCDLKNLYVINQTAQCLDESPVIEQNSELSTAKTKCPVFRFSIRLNTEACPGNNDMTQ